MRRQIELSNEVAAALGGSNDHVLRALEGHVDCDLFLRGNVVTLDGDAEAVASRRRRRARAGRAHRAGPRDLGRGHDRGGHQRAGPARTRRPRSSRTSSGATARARSRPRRSTRSATSTRSARNTVTFGIGPAGTGKTFLAVAMAAAALSRREVNRIILTRPAVEAGERLGFLPGDLMAKIDPYLRPLFDALHDMIDPEKVAAHLERGVIEVAPLAFMRGRAQPSRPPGAHAVRVAADRLARGRRPGDRLRRPADARARGSTRRDASRSSGHDPGRASTLCCAEHLWTVTTPDDRRRGTSARSMRTARWSGGCAGPPAPVRVAAPERAGGVRAAGRADRPLRARALCSATVASPPGRRRPSRPPTRSLAPRSRRCRIELGARAASTTSCATSTATAAA